ncbi:1-acylglycerol-3-phosphate O-acyltransferase [Malassezia pachydermatis]|uniref:1-acyl-sn-glycerol-3-phosphate acyltransferase n=1 Tax=Malassezia pachydermatis TaxID=77020 RepID=A0A0M9VNJ6_9BASI|nr:1-acylglycerol-3-phosphate o-acyltransferase [Malassezia pachydermatis]KOS13423.1 1-acylglycerol-3-phosphate o-acyltransferase [Malassezia pachydermatis]
MGRILRSIVSVGSTSFLLLTLASARSQKARYRLNSILYFLSLGVCSSLGVVYALVLSLFPGKRFHTNFLVARSFLTIAGTLLGYKVTLEGSEHLNTRPALLLMNHQSFLDILCVSRIAPPASIIMAKKELKLVPLLGQFMWLSGTAFIDRKNRASAIKTMAQIGDHMRKHQLSMIMFPEGTRSYLATPGLLPFKKGAFHLAVQAQLPIVPVVCENYYRLFDGRTRFDPGHIRMSALPPIETKGMTEADIGTLMNKVHDTMIKELVRFDEELDRNDVNSALHPTNKPQPYRLYGLSGLAARLIGTGQPKRHIRKLDKIAKDQKQSQGTKPEDFGLVSADQQQTAAPAL